MSARMVLDDEDDDDGNFSRNERDDSDNVEPAIRISNVFSRNLVDWMVATCKQSYCGLHCNPNSSNSLLNCENRPDNFITPPFGGALLRIPCYSMNYRLLVIHHLIFSESALIQSRENSRESDVCLTVRTWQNKQFYTTFQETFVVLFPPGLHTHSNDWTWLSCTCYLVKSYRKWSSTLIWLLSIGSRILNYRITCRQDHSAIL